MIEAPPVELGGIGGSPGIALGQAVLLDGRRPAVLQRRIAPHEVELELSRFDGAVQSSVATLAVSTSRAESDVERAILEAYVLMLQDPLLRARIERELRSEARALEWAIEVAVEGLAAELRRSGDPYLAERSHDFEFVGERLLRGLSGRELQLALPPGDAPCVVVGRDMAPEEMAELDRDRVVGLVIEGGSRSSHTAILARALGLPAVLGVREATGLVGSGEWLLVDGERGRVVLRPDPAQRSWAATERDRRDEVAREDGAATLGPGRTRCGLAVPVRANVELVREAERVIDRGAEGIGLYRTEFLYVGRSEAPSEDEQREAYAAVLGAIAPHPVTLRTFDLGGDKLRFHGRATAEQNPALGLRAVRLGLAEPALLRTQLRAMLRAAASILTARPRLLVPMVATLGELRRVRAELDGVRAELAREGQLVPALPFGVMIEVPSAALMADRLAPEVDFFSIGTNDLVQYTLAADRTNAALSDLANPFDPAVIRLIERVTEAARARAVPVAVCGALAGDPRAVALLVGLGVRELSVEPTSIGAVKRALADVDRAAARRLADRCLDCGTADEVLALVGGDRRHDRT